MIQDVWQLFSPRILEYISGNQETKGVNSSI
jgi:hypothetical protein